MAIKGVDISEHNGSVDFQALKNAGIGFVIIRLGFGSDYTNQDDSRFSENVRKAEAAGMPWGAYLYSYAKNTQMAKSEAQHTLRLLNGRKPLYGVWYDVEDPQIASANVVATSQAFCDAMEAAGLYAGIYASLSWLNGALNSPKLDKYDKWVAQWNSSCTYKKDYGLWQFTDKMVAAGKNFDGNWAYKDYPAIIRGMSGEGEKEPEEPSGEDTFTYEQWKAYKERYEKEISAKPISSWAETAVEWAKKNKIMNGDANGSFRPRSNITREEMAQVAMNEAEVFG